MRTSQPDVVRLRLGRLQGTIGVGEKRPVIGWRFAQSPATIKNWRQSQYELRIRRNSLGSISESTYRTESGDNVDVPWPEKEEDLQSREVVTIGIRVSGDSPPAEHATDEDSEWSSWHQDTFHVGLLDQDDWTARFITSTDNIDTDKPRRPIYLRRKFRLADSDLEGSAPILFATAAGVYELEINGQAISADVLAPGWQPYQHRLAYQTYLVPVGILRAGENVLGAKVGEGWYAGRLGGAARNWWGTRLGLLLQLDFGTGTKLQSSEEGWQWAHGPLVTSELYDGEVFDTAVVSKEWSVSQPETSDMWAWSPVQEWDPNVGKLVAAEAPPNRRQEEFAPIEVICTPGGKHVLDFGQNMSGWVKLRRPPVAYRGTEKVDLVIRYGEIMDKGELDTRSTRGAKATDTIRLSKTSLDEWEPSFTIHGFRFVELSGMDNLDEYLRGDNVRAIAIHADMDRLGTFDCSHEKINKLYSCVEWGLRSNFVSVPTDCPQRDERLGWTGDIATFGPTAGLMFDTKGFLSSWLLGVKDEQLLDRNGVPPVASPDVRRDALGPFPQSIWCDVVALGPFQLYELYGQKGILEEMHESMVTWLEKGIPRDDDGLWDEGDDGFQFGDWCDPQSPPDDGAASLTDPFFVANAFLVHVTGIVSKVASIVHRAESASRWKAEHIRLRDQFRRRYVSPAGRLVSDTQAAFALSLSFNLLESDEEPVAVARLVRLIMKANYRITTGFAGTPFILKALVEHGKVQVAYRMLQERECPSWMHMVNEGATTVWERWDSIIDGIPMQVERPFMPSFNHFAYGTVGEFLMTKVGGLYPLSPGWKTIGIHPHPGGTVTSAKVSHNTPYGLASISWRLEGGSFEVMAQIPPNTMARVTLLGKVPFAVGSGNHLWKVPHDERGDWPPKMISPGLGVPAPAQSFEP